MRTLLFASALTAAAPLAGMAQSPHPFTRADTLRGSYETPGRAWWDVTFYDLHVAISPSDSSIRGRNGITYRVLGPGRELQVDLMAPLEVDSMVQDGRRVPFRRAIALASRRSARPTSTASWNCICATAPMPTSSSASASLKTSKAR